jgi:hypothetical protein
MPYLYAICSVCFGDAETCGHKDDFTVYVFACPDCKQAGRHFDPIQGWTPCPTCMGKKEVLSFQRHAGQTVYDRSEIECEGRRDETVRDL